jgi:hypothetical protein
MYSVDFVGDRLFGRGLRLRLAEWILTQGDRKFYQSEPGLELRGGVSNIRDELGRFLELGMLVEAPPTPADRRRYYRRTDSEFWTAIKAALAASEQHQQTNHG